jgi:acetyl esterase/lipase
VKTTVKTMLAKMMPLCILAIACTVQVAFAQPPMPPGYATAEEAIAAIQSGKVKAVRVDPAALETTAVTNDIEYAKVGDRSLKLDLYSPKDLKKPVPAVIVIHGGGWQDGNKRDMRAYGVHFAQLGYVAASISYRFTGEATHPAQVTDCKAAVRFLRANAAKYNIDPDKIAASGNSAGGHLSMMLGYCDAKEMEGDYGNPGVSSRVQAVVNFYGPTDLTTEYAAEHPVVLALAAGKKITEVPEVYRTESPIFNLTKDDPPTLILHGVADEIVAIAQADMLAGKLAELGVPYEYVRIPGWPHSMDFAQPVFDCCIWHIDRFLEKHLPLPK